MIAYFKQKNNNFYSNNKQNRIITNIIALDGEGWNNSEGVHKYYILSAVDIHNKKKTLYTGKPLTTKECLDFLLSLSNNKEDLFISFAFTNYDVTKILEDLTQEQLKLLRSNKEVTYDDYHIKHLKNKFFTVSRLSSVSSFTKDGKTIQYYKNKITIYDVFSYYSCSFVKVCHQYKHLFKDKNIEIPKITDKDDIELTEVAENNDNEEELIDFITAMKATRSEFKEENLKQIIEYCELENYILATIYKHTLNMCSSIDITPSYHSGPGALAENYLETQNISKYIRLKDSKINNIAKGSYYGGRFETSIIGYAGDGYTYDINSAYPNIIINLPCLSCSSWIHTTNYLPDYTYGFYKVSVSSNLKSIWSPFPFKVTQSNRYDIHDLSLNVNQIFYPIGGTRWVTAEELRIAYKYFSREEIKVLDGYVLDVKCDHTPFSDVITLYERRKEYKKAGNDSQIVIKLIINSLYGKLAQVVGKSKFTSWSWAAWITGHTRSMLADIALKYQNNILMLATDGIVSKCKLPELKVSDNLGDWEFDEVKDIYIFKPGLYVYTDKSGKQIAKRRGYQSSQLSATYLLDKWSSGELIFPTENPKDKFYTYAEAVQRIDFKDKLGQWTQEYKDINLNDTRRDVEKKDNNVITTTPWRINEGVGQYDDLGTKRINYDIKDKDNKLIGREVRLEYQTSDGIKKRIWQESYINNSWVNNASSLKNMLYKLPEVLKVIKQQNKDKQYQIYIVEGCRNAYVLNKYMQSNKINGIATTKLAGALNNIGAYEWLKDARDICFILDNDEAGFKHGKLAYEYLINLNKDINIEFKKSKTEGSGDDIVDHLEKGYKLDELVDVDINNLLDKEIADVKEQSELAININKSINDQGIKFLNEWLVTNKSVLKDIRQVSDKQYTSLCPNHKDHHNSFMISTDRCNFCVRVYCHTCGKEKFKEILKHFINGINNTKCTVHNTNTFCATLTNKEDSLDNLLSAEHRKEQVKLTDIYTSETSKFIKLMHNSLCFLDYKCIRSIFDSFLSVILTGRAFIGYGGVYIAANDFNILLASPGTGKSVIYSMFESFRYAAKQAKEIFSIGIITYEKFIELINMLAADNDGKASIAFVNDDGGNTIQAIEGQYGMGMTDTLNQGYYGRIPDNYFKHTKNLDNVHSCFISLALAMTPTRFINVMQNNTLEYGLQRRCRIMVNSRIMNRSDRLAIAEHKEKLDAHGKQGYLMRQAINNLPEKVKKFELSKEQYEVVQTALEAFKRYAGYKYGNAPEDFQERINQYNEIIYKNIIYAHAEKYFWDIDLFINRPIDRDDISRAVSNCFLSIDEEWESYVLYKKDHLRHWGKEVNEEQFIFKKSKKEIDQQNKVLDYLKDKKFATASEIREYAFNQNKNIEEVEKILCIMVTENMISQADDEEKDISIYGNLDFNLDEYKRTLTLERHNKLCDYIDQYSGGRSYGEIRREYFKQNKKALEVQEIVKNLLIEFDEYKEINLVRTGTNRKMKVIINSKYL